MHFDKKLHISKQKVAVEKLVAYFKKQGISFSPTDGELQNVIFTTKDNKEVKISHHSFYRYSGISVLYKEKDDKSVYTIPMSDDYYLNEYLKKFIEVIILNA